MERLLTLLVFVHLIHGLDVDQGTFLKSLFTSKRLHGGQSTEWRVTTPFSALNPASTSSIQDDGSMKSDLIRRLPGQPPNITFKQYSGYVTVDESHGRSLFYYFVEATEPNPTSRPLLLWLNGGPGCSSLGVGAMVEHGPFGVNRDGETLYLRKHAWNRVANVLYLESPAGVGFSYSNTTSDYQTTGDSRTAQDAYIFLLKWFQRFPQYKTAHFYLAGESYAGFYIPELVDTIHSNVHNPSSAIRVKGIMIGNGIMDLGSDLKGIYDYIWSHALISDQTHQGLLQNCVEPTTLSTCIEYENKIQHEMGNVYLDALNSEPCISCERDFVRSYLNLPQVQKHLHANKTRLPNAWELCSLTLQPWKDCPSSMFPIYKRLIPRGLRILLYSGDMDAVVPVTSTQYAIDALNLTVKIPWRPWHAGTKQVAGYQIDYDGLVFATIRGAGHEAPRLQPLRAFSLVKSFLEGS